MTMGSRTLSVAFLTGALVAAGAQVVWSGSESVESDVAATALEALVEPRIVEMPDIVLVGTVDGAADVGELDIAAMWQRFASASESLEHAIEDAGYELHIQTSSDPPMHYVLTGVQVSELGPLPPDLFAKVLPPSTYAVFTHRVVDGYAKIYAAINAWLEGSEYREAYPFDFQLYDSRFTSMDDPESVQDIYVPVTK